MTPLKKILVAFGAAVVLVVAALTVLPFVFKGRIVQRARAELDQAVAAHVDWRSVGLSFFHDFPNLTLSVADLSVVAPEGPAGAPAAGPGTAAEAIAADTIAFVGDVGVVLDLGSVWRAWRSNGPLVVRSVRIDRPMLDLRVGEDGKANWDIMNRSGADVAAEKGGAGGGGLNASAMSVELSSLQITDGDIAFRNDSTGLSATLDGFDYALGGNFSRDRATARTTAHADRTTLAFGGTSYLNDVALDFRADVDADLAARHFAFQDNELKLNDLTVRFAGDATKQDDGATLDVTFEAPRTDFTQALSLVPAIWATNFASLKTSGTFTLAGAVHGTYGEGSFPAFTLEAVVAGGMFQYPDLPLPARDISLDLSIKNPGGGLDSTVVRLDPFHVVIGDQPLDAAVTLRTPVSDPDVDARVKGTIDLAAVTRTIKLDSVQELNGVVTADASARARLSDIDAGRYERVQAQGSVAARDVTFQGAQLPYPLAVHEMTLALTSRRADLKSLDAQIGGSDVQANGTIDNILAFVLRDEEPLRGSVTVHSRHFVLDEWKSNDPMVEVIPVPAMLDVSLDGTVDSLTYGKLAMSDARGHVTVKDQRLTLDGFTLKTLGGRMGFNGYYDTTEPTRPTFDMGLTVDSLDVAGASAAFLTVRTLAPVARFAQGTFSTKIDLRGALNGDMTPVFTVLQGKGSLLTSRIALEGFPLLTKLAEVVKLPRLSSPTLDAIRSSLTIDGGRMHVRPFGVDVGNLRMSVEGSNGVDQSLDYTLGLTVPRSVMGDAANQFVQGLAEKAGQVGLNLPSADSIRLGVKVGGTITSPTLEVGLGQAAASVGQQLKQAATDAVGQKVDEAKARVDSATAEARRRAQERADSLVADAEAKAEQIRAEAKRLAEASKAEAQQRADSAVVKAGSDPIARAAARAVADRILKAANDRADAAVTAANERADTLVAEARKRAAELVAGAGG